MIGRILFRVELNILVQICKLLTVFTINAAIPTFDWGRKCQTSFDHRQCKKTKNIGRPKNEDQRQAFVAVCEYFESNDEEQITISELVSKMGEYLFEDDSVPYGSQYLKQKLKERYNDSIYIAEVEGLQDIVTMRGETAKILRTYFETSKDGDSESQKRAIIATAAKLLKCDIKTEIPSVTDRYPSPQSLKLDTTLDYLPISLRTMLNKLFVGTDKDEKVAAIVYFNKTYKDYTNKTSFKWLSEDLYCVLGILAGPDLLEPNLILVEGKQVCQI